MKDAFLEKKIKAIQSAIEIKNEELNVINKKIDNVRYEIMKSLINNRSRSYIGAFVEMESDLKDKQIEVVVLLRRMNHELRDCEVLSELLSEKIDSVRGGGKE